VATSEQIKALIKSHFSDDEERFISTALQLAASEAKKGHQNFALELRNLVDEAKSNQRFSSLKKESKQAIPINRPLGELQDLLNVSYPNIRLSDMVLNDRISQRLNRILKEQKHYNKLRSHGLPPKRKILLVGPPGCGKTMTAHAIAGELGLSIFTVRLDGLLTKYLGETTAKLRLIFDAMNEVRGVYLFDEFDSIGSDRGIMNDVGEIKRVLNSFLMYIEHDESNSLIFAATNFAQSLDYALFRRFDDIIEYELPGRKERLQILQYRLTTVPTSKVDYEQIAKKSEGRSYAEITRICEEAIKSKIINDRDQITSKDLLTALSELPATNKK
jgi:SpoVK/Ycf46/Vps4 family AAA+-type ATPase